MSLRDLFLLFVLAALWGASYLFIRVAVPILRPFPLVAIRVVLGGLILLIYALMIGRMPNFRKYWFRFAMIGLFNNAIPFTLIAVAQLNMTASLAALLNATTPLFSAIIAAFWINDKLTPPKLVGLFLGIIGVAIIVGWDSDMIRSSRIIGILLILGGSLSYGVAGVYGKVAFKGVSSLSVSIGQLLSSSLMMIPLAISYPPTGNITTPALYSVLALAVLSTSIAYLIYFHLIDSAGPTNAASVTLLIPFFSSLWGAIFLGERLLFNEIAGFGVILISLLLVTGLWRNFVKPKLTSA